MVSIRWSDGVWEKFFAYSAGMNLCSKCCWNKSYIGNVSFRNHWSYLFKCFWFNLCVNSKCCIFCFVALNITTSLNLWDYWSTHIDLNKSTILRIFGWISLLCGERIWNVGCVLWLDFLQYNSHVFSKELSTSYRQFLIRK